jgi:CHAT domain-containing protein
LSGCHLVTLSACETGLGRAGRGDEQIGLVRAFG